MSRQKKTILGVLIVLLLTDFYTWFKAEQRATALAIADFEITHLTGVDL